MRNCYKVIPWGLQNSFSNEYTVLIMEDEEGLLSTIGEFIIEKDEWRDKGDI